MSGQDECGDGRRAEVAPHAAPSEATAAVCPVCPRHCRLDDGALGVCRARRARGGEVVSENYARVTSLALDPIEKKPLRRFMPGTKVVSLGSYGCNLRCPFCQNSEISQVGANDVPWREISPERVVEVAVTEREMDPSVVGIAYTYNEPLVGWEYVRDCSLLAHDAGLVNVLVSNGCAELGVIEEIAPLIDAANIDLKGFTEEFYRMCGGDLACVMATIGYLARLSTCHLEVTTLVIPGKNDGDEEVESMARWLARLDPQIAYHLSRFFPCWRMASWEPTPVASVYHLADVARRHLRHVYTGNC